MSAPTKRRPTDRAIALLLWTVLWLAVATVIIMTWHPWVIGETRGCPGGQRTAWDGHCHAQ